MLKYLQLLVVLQLLLFDNPEVLKENELQKGRRRYGDKRGNRICWIPEEKFYVALLYTVRRWQNRWGLFLSKI